MIKELSDDQKQTFRAVKCLLQNMLVHQCSSFDYCNTITDIGKTMLLKLYGCKTIIPSYILRALFLHLLLHVQGTDAAAHLTGVVLVHPCLLDMLKQCNRIIFETNAPVKYVHHPLIKSRKDGFIFAYFRGLTEITKYQSI